MSDEAPDQESTAVRVLNPYQMFTGPQAVNKDFSMNVTHIRRDHPAGANYSTPGVTESGTPSEATEAPVTGADPSPVSQATDADLGPETATQDASRPVAPDAEPLPTPYTPTPRPDGQPPAPDAVETPASVVPVATVVQVDEGVDS